MTPGTPEDPSRPPFPESVDAMRLLLDLLPVGMWTTDADLRFTWIKGSPALSGTGIREEDVLGRSLTELRPGDVEDRPAIDAHRRALRGESVGYETDFGGRWYACRVEPLPGTAGSIAGVIGVALDISDRVRAEETLRQATRGYRAIAEITSDFAYSLRASPEGDVAFEWVTDGFERMLGISPAEANRRGVLDLVHPDDLETVRGFLERVLRGETVVTEHRLVTGSGDVRWIRGYAAPEQPPEGGPVARIYGAVQDVTEGVLADQRLRSTLEELRAIDRERVRLLGYLVRAQEEERKRIAEGIHDDSVQAMATVRLRLEALAQAAQDPELRGQLDSLRATVEESVTRLRALLFHLAPPSLHEGGLGAALEELVGRVASEGGLEYALSDELTHEPSEEARIILYRMAQEALTNVRKHARASRVDLRLEEGEGGVLVRIADDGVGFSLERGVRRPGHLGLEAMRERAELARGWWRIESEPGRGTVVEFWIPSSGAEDAGPKA